MKTQPVFRSARLLAALGGFLVLSFATLFSAAPEAGSSTGSEAGSSTDPEAVGAEFVDARVPEVVTASGERREEVLVELWQRVQDRLTRETSLPTRQTLRGFLRERLVDQLRAELGERSGDEVEDAPDRVSAMVASAVERVRLRRELHLFDSFLCDCKTEDWSRTLSYCWEPCREGQRGLVREWLAAGYTDDEIVELMLDKVGTDKVLVGESSWMSRWAPYGIFGAGVLVLTVLLRSARRGGGRFDRSRPRDRMQTQDPGLDVGRLRESADAGTSSDTELQERLEAELKKLED